jgi:hypothetical protein
MTDIDAAKAERTISPISRALGLIPASAFNADVAKKLAEATDLMWHANTLWEPVYDEGREITLTGPG